MALEGLVVEVLAGWQSLFDNSNAFENTS